MVSKYTVYHLFSIALSTTAPNITTTTPLSNASFNVQWTISDTNYAYSFIVIWTNLKNQMVNMATVSGNSHNVTRLDGISNYNVSVATTCGMMMSDPITVYGKN